MPLTPSNAKLPFEQRGNVDLLLSDSNSRQHGLEGLGRQLGGGRYGHHLRRLLDGTQILHDLRRRFEPHSASAVSSQSIRFAGRYRFGFEADVRDPIHFLQRAQRTAPRISSDDLHAYCLGDLFHRLGFVPKIGNQQGVSSTNQHESGRAGETREVSDVGQVGDDQHIETLLRNR